MITRILDGKIVFTEEDAARAQKEQEHVNIRELERMIKEAIKEVEEQKELKDKIKFLENGTKIRGRYIEEKIP
jgi:hypothetical protein